MNFNILHSKSIEDFDVYLVPFCDIYDNDYVSSNYSLWFNSQEANKHNSHGILPFKPNTEIKEILNDTSRIMWSIVVKKKAQIVIPGYVLHQHIGNVSLQKIDMINRSAEVAIIIGETEYHGKGVGKFAIKNICNHGFDKLGLNRIWSGTAATNIGMQNVFESCGFTKEGIFRDGMWLDGKFVNIVEYALLNHDRCTIRINLRDEWHDVKTNFDLEKCQCKKTDSDLINSIEHIRTRNNKHWMDLVRIAMEKDPNGAKKIMSQIVECDKMIYEKSSQLANN